MIKKIIASLKSNRVFSCLSDAYVSAAVSNARVVDVAAGALLMKVPADTCMFHTRVAS
jgi:hypothetical protein